MSELPSTIEVCDALDLRIDGPMVIKYTFGTGSLAIGAGHLDGQRAMRVAVLDRSGEAGGPVPDGAQEIGIGVVFVFTDDAAVDRMIAVLEHIKAAAKGEVCANCECSLPEGCCGMFRGDGEACALNAEVPHG